MSINNMKVNQTTVQTSILWLWITSTWPLSEQKGVAGWMLIRYLSKLWAYIFFSCPSFLLHRGRDSLVVDQFCSSSTSTPQTAVAHISSWKQQKCSFFALYSTFTPNKTWLKAFFRILAIYFILVCISECFEGKESRCFESNVMFYDGSNQGVGAVKRSAFHCS